MGQLESISPKASYLLSSTIHLLQWVHEYKSQGSLDSDRVLTAELGRRFHRLFSPHHKLFGDSLHIGYFTNGVTDLPKTIGLTAAEAEGRVQVSCVSGGGSFIPFYLNELHIPYFSKAISSMKILYR